ncbi:MAG: hypothetical protein HYW27_00200 [Candidatus Aenigmarchaeota archaeon]|nr:hypothetical protein [Candidatus Aenigmarchaeota archaeon]
MEEDFTYNKKKSKLRHLAGFVKAFFSLSRDDFREMDHKLVRIGVSVTTFVVMALFWLFFLKNIVPFKF